VKTKRKYDCINSNKEVGKQLPLEHLFIRAEVSTGLVGQRHPTDGAYKPPKISQVHRKKFGVFLHDKHNTFI